MNMLLSLTLIFIYSSIRAIPLKSDFHDLPPFKEEIFHLSAITSSSLNESIPEVYFSFENRQASGDIVVALSNGFSYSTWIYAYFDYASIAKDENGMYINQDRMFQLSQRQFIIPQDKNQSIISRVYLIVKETSAYFSSNSISIFNELDPLPLTPNSISSINQFHSTLKRRFTLKASPREIITIAIQGLNKEIASTISVFDNKGLLFQTKDSSLQYTSQDSSYEREFTIVLESSEAENSFFLLFKSNKAACEELNANQNKEVHFIQSEEYCFYSKLEHFDVKDEGSVTLRLGEKVNKTILKQFNAKIVSKPKESNVAFEAGDLIEKTQFNYYSIEESDTVFQIPFYHTKQKKEDMNTFIFIFISININIPDKLSFHLGISSKISQIEFANNDIISIKHSLLFNTPSYFKLSLDEGYNYVLFSSTPVLTIYHNSLFSPDYSAINPDSYHNQFHVATANDKHKAKLFLLELYGEAQDIALTIQRTTMNITYFGRYNSNVLESFALTITSIEKAHYLIESLQEWSPRYLFAEIAFGQCDIYFKNDFFAQTEGEEGLLPMKSTQQDHNLISLSEYNSIIGLKCSSPSYLKMNAIRPKEPFGILKESREIFFLAPEKAYSMHIKGKYNAEFGVEVCLLSFEAEINIIVNRVYYKLNALKKKIFIMAEEDTDLIEWMSNSEAFVSIRMGADKESFLSIDNPGEYTNDNTHVLFTLSKSQRYDSVSFEIANVDIEGLQYEIIQSKAFYFISLPSLGNNHLVKPDEESKFLLHMANPYVEKENDFFFIAISFLATNSTPKQKHIIKFSFHNNTQPHNITESSTEIPSDIPAESNTAREGDDKYLYDSSIIKDLSKQIVRNEQLNSQFSLLLHHSHGSYDRVEYSYAYSSIDHQIKPDISRHLIRGELNYDPESNELSWTMSKEIVGNYKIYIIKQGHNTTSLNNYSYLSSLRYSKEIQSFTAEANKSTPLPTVFIGGNCFINIIARFNSLFPMEAAFSSIMITIPAGNWSMLGLHWIVAPLILISIAIMWFVMRKRRTKQVIESNGIKAKSFELPEQYEPVESFDC